MNDETEIDPGYAERHETEMSFQEDLNTTYAMLDELVEQLAEACEEQTEWKEEIDRQNLRSLLQSIDEVEHVRGWIQEILDPLGKPSTDDPAQ